MIMDIQDQISPVDEFCWRCDALGLPGIIPAGEEYKRLANGVIEQNICADCWNRLHDECSSEDAL